MEDLRIFDCVQGVESSQSSNYILGGKCPLVHYNKRETFCPNTIFAVRNNRVWEPVNWQHKLLIQLTLNAVFHLSPFIGYTGM